jgi:hypothetical protein
MPASLLAHYFQLLNSNKPTMKALLLLAAIHMLIIYQSRKQNDKTNDVLLPAPAAAPAKPASTNKLLSREKQACPSYLSVLYMRSYGRSALAGVIEF